MGAWEQEQRAGAIYDLPLTTTIPPLSTIQLGRIRVPRIEPPEVFSVLVGEIVYNLRAALDHLVYELARMDSGAEQAGTQFPIFSKAEAFNRQRLTGVSDAHVAMLEAMQPFNGGAWLARLAEISNRDKHRKLFAVLRPVSAVTLQAERPESAAATSTHLKVILSVPLMFPDRALVLPTLKSLSGQVGDTIETFRPEFT